MKIVKPKVDNYIAVAMNVKTKKYATIGFQTIKHALYFAEDCTTTGTTVFLYKRIR